jgi:hypothetical protein
MRKISIIAIKVQDAKPAHNIRLIEVELGRRGRKENGSCFTNALSEQMGNRRPSDQSGYLMGLL